MSVRNVQALVLGFPGSGKTTLITRWVTGDLPTDKTKAFPFNGVKSINIMSKKHHIKELVVVRFIDGSDVSDDDMRRLCHTVDVIVACMCVELNGLDQRDIKELNDIFTQSRRPPIIVLGTMLDLRYNIQDLFSNTSEDEENKEDETKIDRSSNTSIGVVKHTTSELSVANVTKHRVSFSFSSGDDADQHVESGLMSEGDLSDVNERNLTSITESEGITELDSPSISFDTQTSAFRTKNPAFWSTESINGSLVTSTRLDMSQDSLSDHNVEEKLLKEEVQEARTEIEASAEAASVNDTKDCSVSYPKPLLETHFPLTLDIPLTVKHFPPTTHFGKQYASQTVIPYKEEDWFSEDEPDEVSFQDISSSLTKYRKPARGSKQAAGVSGLNGGKAETTQTEGLSSLQRASACMNTRHLKEGLALLSATASPSSVSPEDRNFHVNLDPDPVRLTDHNPDHLCIRFNINGYCRDWSVADGVKLARSIKGDTYMECSAYSGQNLQEVFEYIARVGCKYNKKRNEKCTVS